MKISSIFSAHSKRTRLALVFAWFVVVLVPEVLPFSLDHFTPTQNNLRKSTPKNIKPADLIMISTTTMTNHHSHDHQGGPTLPCGTCRKRHVRGGAAVPGSGRVAGLSTMTARKGGPGRRALISFAALAAVAIAIAPDHVHAATVADSFSGGEGEGIFRHSGGVAGIRSVAGHQPKLRQLVADDGEDTSLFDTSAALDAAGGHDEEEHEDHEGEHAGHIHDEHGNEVEEEHDHDHNEPNADMMAFLDMDSHSGQDHSEHMDHDDHSAHDHSTHEDHGDAHEDHDDHSGHDHSNHLDHDDHNHDEHDHSAHKEEFSSFSSVNESQKLPWGEVIGATLLVNLAALSGTLIIVATAVHSKVLKLRGNDASRSGLVGHGLFFDICIPAFAVGALVATAVFLIFPEALHLIEGGHGAHAEHSDGEEADTHDDHSGHNHRYLQEDSHAGHDDSSESVNAAKFGCAILGGFLLPLVFAIIFHRNEDGFDVDEGKDEGRDEDGSVQSDMENCASCRSPSEIDQTVKTMADSSDHAKRSGLVSVDVEEGVPASNEETTPLTAKTVVDRQLCASILLGDAFHNFADGVFIGAAFKSCSTGTALSIILVTLFHEIAQELADFILLTRYAGLGILKACALNFISGLSVCLGGIVFLAGDPSDEATGIILAMAGGVYFNIAGCETIPRLEAVIKSRSDRIWTLFSVIVGIVPIGLILLNHQHCG